MPDAAGPLSASAARLGRELHIPPLACAALGGGCYALGFLGWGVWPLMAVFLVPLWTALERVRSRGPGATMAVGLAFGAAAFALGFGWLWHLVDEFLGGRLWVGALLFGLYGLWFAAGFAAYAGLYRGIRARGWPVALAGGAPLVALEWLIPQLFPVHAGSALLPVLPLVQMADLGGPMLLSAWLTALNGVVFASWCWLQHLRRGPAPPFAAWLAGVALVLAAFAYGELRMAALDREAARAPALEVGVVQANLGLLEKRTQGVVSQRRHLEQSRELLAAGPLDLLVWPETAYVRGLRGPLPISGAPVVRDLGVPLLFGGAAVHQRDGRRWRANAAFLVSHDGVIRDAYEKNLLIPLAEYAPLARVVPALEHWLPHTRSFRASRETPALHLGPWRLATPICYEAIRPSFVRRMVETTRAHLLVTLANDAWFGDSQEPWLHLSLARLRAVEQRRYLVRATNSGISAIVDASGRILTRSALFTSETLRATVHPLQGRTLYARIGDWPGWLALALVGCGLAARAPRARARPR